MPEENNQPTHTPAAGDPQGGQPQEPVKFDDWIAKQDEPTKALLEEHTKGLRSALETERGSRKDLERQVRELAGKAEKGSDLEQRLTGVADQLKSAEQKAGFYEAAAAAGATNLQLAYLAAREIDAFKRDGSPDIEAVRAKFPELFRPSRPTPPANGGEGTGANGVPARTGDMNALIRRAAGFQS